jgi:hypothetical protein
MAGRGVKEAGKIGCRPVSWAKWSEKDAKSIKAFDNRPGVVLNDADGKLKMNTTFKPNLCAMSIDRQMSIWHRVSWLDGNVGGIF